MLDGPRGLDRQRVRVLALAFAGAIVVLLLLALGRAALAITASTTTVVAHNSHDTVVTSIEVGRPVHAFVTVAGAGGPPAGTVVVQWFTNGSCSGTAADTIKLALVAGSVDATAMPVTRPLPTTISFKATYPGNGTFAPSAACLSVSVTKGTPSMGTVVHDTTHFVVIDVPIDSVVHVNVEVKGAAGTPTGGITINRYAGATCTGTPVTDSATLAVGVAEGGSHAEHVVAEISYQVVYHGDTAYLAKTGTCVHVTWSKTTPEIALALHFVDHTRVKTDAQVGANLHASVSFDGLSGPTTTVVLQAFKNGTCAAPVFSFAAIDISAGNVDDATQTVVVPSSPAQWSYRVAFTGDAKYLPANSNCVVIQFKGKAKTTVAIHDQTHAATTQLDIGDSSHTSTTVTGSFGVVTGNITVRRYAGGTCAIPSQTAEFDQFLVIGAKDDAFDSIAEPATGTFSYDVHYQGDTNYLTSVSDCVAYQVVRAAPSLVLEAHDAAHVVGTNFDLGEAFHLRVTVGGAAGPGTGNLALDLYANGDCSGVAVMSKKLALTNGESHDSTATFTPATPGTWSVAATYAGDLKYLRGTICVAINVLAPGATPPPPTPTPIPTAGPGTSPAPSSSTTPGTSTAPGETGVPGSSETPTGSELPGGSGLPGSSGAPGDSTGPGGSEGAATAVPGSSGGPVASPGGGPLGSIATALGLDPTVLGAAIGGLVLLLLLILFASRRRRRPPISPPPIEPPTSDPPAPAPDLLDPPDPPDPPVEG